MISFRFRWPSWLGLCKTMIYISGSWDCPSHLHPLFAPLGACRIRACNMEKKKPCHIYWDFISSFDRGLYCAPYSRFFAA